MTYNLDKTTLYRSRSSNYRLISLIASQDAKRLETLDEINDFRVECKSLTVRRRLRAKAERLALRQGYKHKELRRTTLEDLFKGTLKEGSRFLFENTAEGQRKRSVFPNGETIKGFVNCSFDGGNYLEIYYKAV